VENCDCLGKWVSRCALLITLLIMSHAHFTLASDIRARAVLQAEEITLGDSTILAIVIEGTPTVGRPQIPTVDGLEFSHVGQSTNLQFINGVMSGGVTHSYRVVPQREGTFTISEIQVVAGKSTVKTNSLTLRVRNSSILPLPPTSSKMAPPASSGSSFTNSTASAISSEAAMIELVYPRRDFYVGELAPADLKVHLHPELQIEGVSHPTLSGTAFTVSKLADQPEQTQEIIHGVRYTVLTWHTAVAAVKTGEHPLGAQIECVILVREPLRHRSRSGNSPFDDFFSDGFLNRVQQKRIILRSQDSTVKILPLPAENRPPDFSGAIGRFQVSASAVPMEVTAGDPVTFKLTLSGTGNFDRVRAPELSKSRNLKTYAPSAKFEPSDETGYVGQKIFEQVIVPQNTEINQIPGLPFSFFDPENRKYATITSAAVPLRVLPAPAQATTALPVVPTTDTGQRMVAQPLPTAGVVELVPNKLEPGRMVSNFTPIILKPWFWCVPSLSLLALAVAWGAARRRERLASDPDFARTVSANRVIREQLGILERSLKEGDAQTFFAAARRILQERLGERLGTHSETITLSEIENHLKKDSTLIHTLREIFQTADAVAYSGQAFSSERLSEWKRAVLEMLKKLDGKK